MKLTTKWFEFDKDGMLTIFLERISNRMFRQILKMCNAHARCKHTKKPCKYRIVPTLTEAY